MYQTCQCVSFLCIIVGITCCWCDKYSKYSYLGNHTCARRKTCRSFFKVSFFFFCFPTLTWIVPTDGFSKILRYTCSYENHSEVWEELSREDRQADRQCGLTLFHCGGPYNVHIFMRVDATVDFFLY